MVPMRVPQRFYITAINNIDELKQLREDLTLNQTRVRFRKTWRKTDPQYIVINICSYCIRKNRTSGNSVRNPFCAIS